MFARPSLFIRNAFHIPVHVSLQCALVWLLILAVGNFFTFSVQIGKTKVFLRAGQMADLDTRRSEVLGRSASIIQRKVRSYLARRSFILLQRSAIQIQALCRGTNCILHRCGLHVSSLMYSVSYKFNLLSTGQHGRLVYEGMRREAASLRIQTALRMHLAQKAYQESCCAAVSIQTGMRGMAARSEIRFRRQTKAAIIIQVLFNPMVISQLWFCI